MQKKKGNVHFAKKEYHKALESYKKGLEHDQENKECKDGLIKTQSAIYQSNESPEEQQKRAEQAMKDPEIQQIMMTPEIQNALKAMQSNP